VTVSYTGNETEYRGFSGKISAVIFPVWKKKWYQRKSGIEEKAAASVIPFPER
jgi:hypothetical protein